MTQVAGKPGRFCFDCGCLRTSAQQVACALCNHNLAKQSINQKVRRLWSQHLSCHSGRVPERIRHCALVQNPDNYLHATLAARGKVDLKVLAYFKACRKGRQ